MQVLGFMDLLVALIGLISQVLLVHHIPIMVPGL